MHFAKGVLVAFVSSWWTTERLGQASPPRPEAESRALQEIAGAALECPQLPFEPLARRLDAGGISVRIHVEWRTHRDADHRIGFGDLGAVPGSERPVTARFQVKGQDGVAGELREPHGAWLRHLRRPPGTV